MTFLLYLTAPHATILALNPLLTTGNLSITLFDNIFIFLGNVIALAVLAFPSVLLPWTNLVLGKEISKILLCAS